MKNLKLNWVTAPAVALFHFGFVAALFYFNWQRLLLAGVVWTVGGSLGIGVCFHRLLTHRGYKTPKWVEYMLTLCGCLTLQGGPIWWVAWHRIHHRFTEKPGKDPHTPLDGKFWSHMGWLIYKNPELHDRFILQQWGTDLCKDPVHVVINRISWVPLTFLGIVLFSFGGFPAVLWGAVVPVVVGWHGTWLVNSATHIWGSRAFETQDNSRNNWWVALLSFGEGWHNNHHHNPVSARHGIRWFQFDQNWYIIRLMRLVGLAWDVKEA